ncbi:putative serine/threonine-protein phosphatase with EF-hands [Plasmopara halstedii]
MGRFGKGSLGIRVAEGGGGMLVAAADSPIVNSNKSSNFELFGADSDDSDDDATIDRYAKNGKVLNTSEASESEKKEMALINSKLTPEELFAKYDTDKSGNISAPEFLAMLPEVGVYLSAAKAMRVFRQCDTDGGGEIDLAEFKMAMFTVDTMSHTSKRFSPSLHLSPRDVFELFDEDGSGQIDNLELADVLEYLGMDVSDEKQEMLLKKYDKDKDEKINYEEFRAMWVSLVNVKEELMKRGAQVPKQMRAEKLQQMLEAMINKEESEEAIAFEEAQKFLQRQRVKEFRTQLGGKAIIRAQDELAAALDAAGQVYVLGRGKFNRFCGTTSTCDERLAPGFTFVSELWSSRVEPAHQNIHARMSKAASGDVKLRKVFSRSSEVASKQPPAMSLAAHSSGASVAQYVRRRPENKRWTYKSPSRLNKTSLLQTKVHTRAIENERDKSDEQSTSDQIASLKTCTEQSEVEEITCFDCNQNEEELAKIHFDNREFVRSLRFRSSTLMSNTGPLWGRGVVQGAISDSVAFAVTDSGSVYSWGVNNSSYKALNRNNAGLCGNLEMIHQAIDMQHGFTPRSAVQTSCTLQQEAFNEIKLFQNEEYRLSERHRVSRYYDVWEPPPNGGTRMLYLNQVLLPKIAYEHLVISSQFRGLECEQNSKMDLILALGECFELEIELKGEEGHAALKEAEKMFRDNDQKNKVIMPQTERSEIFEKWQNVKTLRRERYARCEKEAKKFENQSYSKLGGECRAAPCIVRLEGTIVQSTARGNKLPRGVTASGLPLTSPRNSLPVANVSTGGSHLALLTQAGSLYTCGIGTSGRLGLQPNEQGVSCYDTIHPHRVEAFDGLTVCQVSCSFSHSAAIDSKGFLYTWGSASTGELGVGIAEDRYKQYSSTPLLVKFSGKRSIRSVSCGASHTGAVSTAGELFMWGSANGGRLGLGSHVRDCVVVPTLVKELMMKKIRVWQVSCGVAHSAFCTEITSEFSEGRNKLLGGQVYVCGGATALNRYVLSWEQIPDFTCISVCQVACGGSHTAAVSSYGELYTWGRNSHGCTGHNANRLFIEKPELLKCLHVAPYNLALGKPSRQISIYNEQGPNLAVNGKTEGALAVCIHTQMEDNPWWEVDLGQLAVIEKIRLWNRTDEPSNPSKKESEYSGRLFPCWIFVSEVAFKKLDGKEGLRAAKLQSNAFELFHTNKRMTEWIIPSTNTVGQFVRVQLQNKNFLHIAEVEVFGIFSAFNFVGKVGTVQCSTDATLVIMPPISTQSVLDDYYLRAIQADADNAKILCHFKAYERSFRKFGCNIPETFGSTCRLCRVFRKCEICEFYALIENNYHGSQKQTFSSQHVGDRLGLKEFINKALAEETLHAEQPQQLCEEKEVAKTVLQAENDRQHEQDSTRTKRQIRLLKSLQNFSLRTKNQ